MFDYTNRYQQRKSTFKILEHKKSLQIPNW